MKKIITSAVFVLIAMISFAQTQVNSESSTHLAFKGVPIYGTLDDYVLQMKKNGFNHIGTEDGIAMLEGDFASYKNCIVVVATLKQKDLVSKISVMFPEQAKWSSLSSDYFILKKLLTEKYGKPSESTEKFDGTQPDDDNTKCIKLNLTDVNITQLMKQRKVVFSYQSNTRE